MADTEDEDRKAVAAANAEFYRAFGAGDFPAMDALWANSAEVVCIHPGWPPVRGREDVMASWRGILSNPPEPALRPAEEQVSLMGEVAMVVCFETIGEIFLAATNLFLREGGAWRLVHHHAGVTEHRPRTARPEPSGTLH
jgi:ketosteroid isomerase-like protein